MAENRSYVVTEDIEMNEGKKTREVEPVKSYSYEEALDLTGNGKYNIGLLSACFIVMTAMGTEIFGLGIIVTASACDLGMSATQIGILSSMPFAGIIIMSYLWGYLSDTRGRKVVLMVAMGGSFVTSTLSSMATSWQILAVLRFLGSALCCAAESATYALLGECCTSKVRAKYMLLMTSALMLTPTLYYLSAYLILKLDFAIPITFLCITYKPWRLLTLVMALPLGFGALSLYFFNESPKFLANIGKNLQAVEVLKNIYEINNGSSENYVVKEIYLEEGIQENNGRFTLQSLWVQIAPLFKQPLLLRTLQLYYLTFVVYIANNSFAIVLPYIFNVFFTSYETNSEKSTGFCDLFSSNHTSDTTKEMNSNCNETIVDNTIWAGCVHGCSFFLLNALISQCAGKRRILTMVILILAAIAAIFIDNTGEPITGLILFLLFMTTAMIFGVISSYFVDLYPTRYRGMVACLGMMVARLSALTGTNILTNTIGTHCAATLYGAAGVILSGAAVSFFLPTDT